MKVPSMEEIWNKGSKRKREQLLEARGLHKSFARVKNYNELEKRDGAHVKRSLNELHSEWKKEDYEN